MGTWFYLELGKVKAVRKSSGAPPQLHCLTNGHFPTQPLWAMGTAFIFILTPKDAFIVQLVFHGYPSSVHSFPVVIGPLKAWIYLISLQYSQYQFALRIEATCGERDQQRINFLLKLWSKMVIASGSNLVTIKWLTMIRDRASEGSIWSPPILDQMPDRARTVVGRTQSEL